MVAGSTTCFKSLALSFIVKVEHFVEQLQVWINTNCYLHLFEIILLSFFYEGNFVDESLSDMIIFHKMPNEFL